MIAFDFPWILAALPVAALPLVRRWLASSNVPNTGLRVHGGNAAWIDHILISVGIIGIAALIIGLAAPFLRGGTRLQAGFGTNLVLLIDRSSSMDETFAGRAPSGDEESKSAAARRILLDFVDRRPDDRIGIAAFSTAPLEALPLTQSRTAVRAAVQALDELGLSQTDVGKGLALAMGMMDEATASGSRAVLMVSDGAGVIAPDVQKLLTRLAARQKVNIYWLYLRGEGAKSIFEPVPAGEPDSPQLRPERHLHLFLQRLGQPYRAFEAESPDAVSDAVEEIGKLESRPILTERAIPRRDLAWLAYLVATLAAGGLCLARGLERAYAPHAPKPILVRS
jgi:mxaC protein